MTDTNPASRPTYQRVVAVVARRDGKVFVCQRPPHKRHGLLWEFPGGKVDSSETLTAAAARELDEELGLRVLASGEVLSRIVDSGSAFEIHFLEVVIEGDYELREHVDARWVTLQELLNLHLAPTDRVFAHQLTLLEA